MQTRSQTRSQPNYKPVCESEVYINFDEATAAWRANKKSIGNGSYEYICCAEKNGNNGKKCGIKCLMGEMYCRMHYKNFVNPIRK
jgi:hypothetical protein